MLLGLVAGDSLRDSFLQWFDSMGDRSLLAPDDSQRDRIQFSCIFKRILTKKCCIITAAYLTRTPIYHCTIFI